MKGGVTRVDLADVFRQHQQAIYAYLMRTTGSSQLAEELTQETFYRACKGAMRFRGDSPVRPWLFGIARNVLLEASRKGVFRGNQLDDEVPAPLDDVDTRLDVEAAFSTLPLHDREALVLVDMLGFRAEDAARILDIEPGALRMRLHRARGRMRSHMEVVG